MGRVFLFFIILCYNPHTMKSWIAIFVLSLMLAVSVVGVLHSSESGHMGHGSGCVFNFGGQELCITDIAATLSEIRDILPTALVFFAASLSIAFIYTSFLRAPQSHPIRGYTRTWLTRLRGLCPPHHLSLAFSSGVVHPKLFLS